MATLVASEVSPERVFTAVSEECARVLEVNASIVVRYEGDETATIVGRHNRDGIDVFLVGDALPADEQSAIGRVLRTGTPARIDDWGGRDGEIAEAMFRTGYRSTAAAPIVVVGSLWGAVAIASEDPLPPDSEDRLGAFCELVSLAVASAQARADLVASRARLVKAGDEQRRRLERNLHDGAQQRLVSVALMLRLARAQLELGPERHGGACSTRRRASSTTGLGELREIARGLHPAVLAEPRPRARAGGARRTAPGRRRASTRRASGCPSTSRRRRTTSSSEALTNVAKHARGEPGAGVGPARRRRRCASRSPTTAAAARIRPAGPASSASATAPRPPAGRCW